MPYPDHGAEARQIPGEPQGPVGPGETTPSLNPDTSASPIQSLANLFLALFLVVAGSSIGAALSRDVLNPQSLESYLVSLPNPGDTQESSPDRSTLRLVAGIISQALGALAIFPFQVLALVWMASNPALSPIPVCFKAKGYRWSPLSFLFFSLGIILASQVAWFFLGIIWTNWMDQRLPSHPLNQILQLGGKLGFAMVVAQGCLMAPVLEEFLSRGFLLALLGRIKPWVAVGVGICVSLFLLGMGLGKLWAPIENKVYWCINSALVCILVFFPTVFLFLIQRTTREGEDSESQAWAGVAVSSQIFCAMHSTVWPAPLALLPLSCGLGWLRAKGVSLLACMMIHAAFNSLSLILAIFLGNSQAGM